MDVQFSNAVVDRSAKFNHTSRRNYPLPDHNERGPCLNTEPAVYSLAAVSRRLRQLRQALGFSQSELCRLTGINPQVWNNAETGDNMLSVVNAIRLYEKTSVHLHWIYCGMMDATLPPNIRDAIITHQTKPKPPREPADTNGGRRHR